MAIRDHRQEMEKKVEALQNDLEEKEGQLTEAREELLKVRGDTTRDGHFWQKYYTVLADNSLNIIQKSANQEPHAGTHARTQARTRKHRRHTQ